MREIPETASFSSSNRLPLRSRVSRVTPVTFPPGRAKLSMSPVATGSTTVIMTMGIVLDACMAARMTTGLVETTPAIGKDGLIYVGSDDKKLYALKPADGSVLFNVTTGGIVRSSPAIGRTLPLASMTTRSPARRSSRP